MLGIALAVVAAVTLGLTRFEGGQNLEQVIFTPSSIVEACLKCKAKVESMFLQQRISCTLKVILT